MWSERESGRSPDDASQASMTFASRAWPIAVIVSAAQDTNRKPINMATADRKMEYTKCVSTLTSLVSFEMELIYPVSESPG